MRRRCSHPATRLPGNHATQLRAATHPFYRRARAHVGPVRAGRAAPWGLTWRTPRLPRTTRRRCLGPCRWGGALCSARTPHPPFSVHHSSQYPPRASSPTDTYHSSEAADGGPQTGDRGTFSLHARRSGDCCTPQPPLVVPGRALPATTWEKVAVSNGCGSNPAGVSDQRGMMVPPQHGHDDGRSRRSYHTVRTAPPHAHEHPRDPRRQPILPTTNPPHLTSMPCPAHQPPAGAPTQGQVPCSTSH